MSAPTTRGPSVRRVLALTTITLALAAAVGIGGERRARTTRPLLVPGLRFDDVIGVELTTATQPALVVELTGDAPRVTAPVAAAADESAVRDLISAVASARFDRVTSPGRAAGLDAPREALRLRRRAGNVVELRVGAAVPASAQAWVAVDGRAGLVPAWVADAVIAAPARLRRTQIFPGAAAITAVEVHGPGLDLVLAGAPLRRLDDGTKVAIDPARRDRLLDRLASATLATSTYAPRTEPGVTVRVLGGPAPAELRGRGPCPGDRTRVVVEASIGVGCVDAAALDELIADARALTGADAIAVAPLERFDRTTIAALDIDLDGVAPARLEPDGAGWRVTAGARSWPADPALVRAAAAALTAPARVVPAPARPAGERWSLRRPSGNVEAWQVDRAAARVTIRRDREPVALELEPDAAAAVRAIGADLRDRALAAIDPVALAGVTAAGAAPAAVERGALIGEWRVTTPPGATATPAVAALALRLAALRAEAWLAPGDLGRVRRTLRLTVDAAPGAPPRTVTIEVGAARGPGCAARVDGGDVARLTPADCAALLAPLATP